ncbi:MAG: hypothetical protein HUJ96_02845 [Marinilabiliaceae bacterium]|nr:hypothetical protein [Marinilabiliaceae bacterium]
MELTDVKSLAIGCKAVKKLSIDGKVIWQKKTVEVYRYIYWNKPTAIIDLNCRIDTSVRIEFRGGSNNDQNAPLLLAYKSGWATPNGAQGITRQQLTFEGVNMWHMRCMAGKATLQKLGSYTQGTHTAIIDYLNRKAYIDDELLGTFSHQDSYEGFGNLFVTNSNASDWNRGNRQQVEYIKIYHNDELIHHYVPAKVDDRPCLYDIIEQVPHFHNVQPTIGDDIFQLSNTSFID